MNTIYLDSKDVPLYLRNGYTGKKFKVVITDTISVPIDAGLWSGGSRDSYSFVELASGRSVPSPCQQTAPWDGRRQEFNSPLPAGIAMVERSMFCGKDAGLTFYIHPDAATKMLPEKTVELTETQKLVLGATRNMKSSYNGKDRYENSKPYGAMSYGERAERQAQVESLYLEKGNVKLKSGKMASDRIDELKSWSNFFPSREEWDTAKDQLIDLGLLNKAGSITNHGRNAR